MFDGWPAWADALFAYLTVQRLGELVYARRNTRRLLAQGGREYGAAHYPLFFLLHGGWLLSIAVFARPAPVPVPALLALFLLSQMFRFWMFASIGRWWTTRIISAPNFPTIRRGPYRWLRHPNYLLVVVEIALVPLLFDAVRIAWLFSALNAVVLAIRITVEDRVLAQRLGDRLT